MSAPAFLVGNRTGGQGKTLISQMIHYGHILGQMPIKAVSADSAKAGGESKLGRLLGTGNVVELGTGADMSAVREDHHEAVRYWDQLGEHLYDGNCVIDLGANILPLIFQWATERKAARLLRDRAIALVVPVTAQAQSISDAIEMLEMSDACQHVLPISQRYVILNEYHGTFDRLQGDRRFQNLLNPDLGLNKKVVRLSKANVEIWGDIEARNMSFHQLGNMQIEEYKKVFELPTRFAASGAEIAFDEWNKATLECFVNVGLVPAAALGNLKGAEKKDGVSADKKAGAKAA
ncbi:MAG: hypothetical protein DI537_05305 [Stutzerimonas stutzeri]|nr:MAG: hypothetical protein DI537_05305 [Stutzerimonas stutzeri]